MCMWMRKLKWKWKLTGFCIYHDPVGYPCHVVDGMGWDGMDMSNMRAVQKKQSIYTLIYTSWLGIIPLTIWSLAFLSSFFFLMMMLMMQHVERAGRAGNPS